MVIGVLGQGDGVPGEALSEVARPHGEGDM